MVRKERPTEEEKKGTTKQENTHCKTKQ